MDRSGLLMVMIVLGYLGFEVYGVHSSRHLMEPQYIFEKYLAAQYAAQRCAPQARADHDQFAHNLAVMRRKALSALAEESPQLDEEALSDRLQRSAAAKLADVKALIDEQGCDAKATRIQVLTYEQSSRLRLQ